MKKNIYVLVFLTINFISAQTKSKDYFSLYKGGEKYLKPVKYLMFDSNESDNIKVDDKGQTYFQIKEERFRFDIKNNKVNSYSIDILKKIRLENPTELKNEAFKFFKNKKEEVENKNKIKLVYPPAGYQNYFKIYILEKTANNKLLKYEVNWEYLDF